MKVSSTIPGAVDPGTLRLPPQAASEADSGSMMKLLIGAAAIGGIYFAWRKSQKKAVFGDMGDSVSNELIEQVGKLAEVGRCDEAVEKAFKVRSVVGTSAERGLYQLQLLHLNRNCKKLLKERLTDAAEMREEIGERFTSLVKNDAFRKKAVHGKAKKLNTDIVRKRVRDLNKAIKEGANPELLQNLQKRVENARETVRQRAGESLVDTVTLLDSITARGGKAGRKSTSMRTDNAASLINKIRPKLRSGALVPAKRKTRSDKGSKKK